MSVSATFIWQPYVSTYANLSGAGPDASLGSAEDPSGPGRRS